VIEIDLIDLKNKNVVIFGLARSGVGAANLLARYGALVTVTDKKDRNQLSDFVYKLDKKVRLSLGGHDLDLIKKADLIVTSPGVPLSIEPLRMASENGIKIIGELELAYQFAIKSNNKKPEFLAITGTNGKSTTTALLYEMIKNSGFNVLVGGNIGNALTDMLLDDRELLLDYIVAEVSSFQLETIDEFRPKGAAILNITPDHLDRYQSMSEYIDAKCRIFHNQREDDFLILNYDDPITEEIVQKIKNKKLKKKASPEIFYFSRRKEVEGAYLKDGMIWFNLPEYKTKNLKTMIQNSSLSFYIKTEAIKIKGVHNMENVMAASIIALLSGCNIDSISFTLERFAGLEHRLEFVRQINGVKFINDSKATNIGAVIKSIESFDNPLILIMGGRDKDGNFSLLKDYITDKVKAIILIGEATNKIENAIKDVLKEIYKAGDLKSAIDKSMQIAKPGDVVLLSPACASFDMFKDFEDRGRQFKKMVMDYETTIR
jgi:UDP-N-acetylmuramoylalanine--D-glutamate ligase